MRHGLGYVLEWGDFIGEGDTRATECTVGAVAKRNSKTYPYAIANELICFRLGLEAGVPVVPGVLLEADNDGEPAYLSLRFGPHGERPPPIIPEEAVAAAPKECALIVAFDMWICNTDRHDENVAFKKRGSVVELLAFDHDLALFATRGSNRLLECASNPCVDGCLAPVLLNALDLSFAAKAIAEVKYRSIQRAVDPVIAAGLISEKEGQALVTFLETRASGLPTMMSQAVQAGRFGAIKQGILP